MDGTGHLRYPPHVPLMQTDPHVSVLRALTVMIETFEDDEMSQLLQFHLGNCVDMGATRL